MVFINKEQFLEQHNKLSPPNLKATFVLLDRFQKEKRPLLKDDGWSLDKLRIPFISWLTTIHETEKKKTEKSSKKEEYKSYPETHYDV